jgi:propionaldehyde dehydrogenase
LADQKLLIKDVTRMVMEKLSALSETPNESVDQLVQTAVDAQRAWQWDFLLEERIRIINATRRELLDERLIEELSLMALEETGMGRLDDKILKKRLAVEKTPGPEFFRTNAISGDHGLALEELSPFGVIVSITPSTNPVASVFNNAICMIAGGNGVVFADGLLDAHLYFSFAFSGGRDGKIYGGRLTYGITNINISALHRLAQGVQKRHDDSD